MVDEVGRPAAAVRAEQSGLGCLDPSSMKKIARRLDQAPRVVYVSATVS
jgi:hypothetical protein